MQPMNSAITGVLSQVSEVANSIGQRPGETGSEIALTESARNWLAGRKPEATDQALRTWLQSSQGVAVNERTEIRYPTEGGFYSVPVGCDLVGNLTDQAAAVRRLELAMTPLSRDDAETLVTMLHVATASAKRSGDGAELALDLYASNLCLFPADVARAACEQAAKGRGGTAWFPTLAELLHACETLAAPRRQMLAAVKAWTPTPPKAEETMTRMDWLHAGAQADAELYGIPKPDPERQSELKEFIAACYAKAKELRAA